VAGIPKLFLHAGQPIGVDVDQSDVPAVFGQQPGGNSADSRRTTGPRDDGGARVRQWAYGCGGFCGWGGSHANSFFCVSRG
jgi:hypothetical protein